METPECAVGAHKILKPCSVCGESFYTTEGVRGRPQIYCGDQCRRAAQMLEWLEKYVARDGFTPRLVEAKALRARLWRLGNKVAAK